MDPGNFATNIEAGARFGYELLWVLLWSNAMAILVQYLAAKLGIATGRTLPENCRAEFSRTVHCIPLARGGNCSHGHGPRRISGRGSGFLSCCSGFPCCPPQSSPAICVMMILAVEQLGFQWLERVIMFFVGVIGVSYAVEMFLSETGLASDRRKMCWCRKSISSIYLAVSMLGATVMPHVIYLHSALVLPRREVHDREEHHHRKMELLDVLLAMNGAWLINSAMVVMAAAVFFGGGLHVYSIEAAHDTLVPLLGQIRGNSFCRGIAVLGPIVGYRGDDGRPGNPAGVHAVSHQHLSSPPDHHDPGHRGDRLRGSIL